MLYTVSVCMSETKIPRAMGSTTDYTNRSYARTVVTSVIKRTDARVCHTARARNCNKLWQTRVHTDRQKREREGTREDSACICVCVRARVHACVRASD